MNVKMKTVKTAMMTAALALMTATFAYADANPANDSGSFTVRITPNVDLGVLVDTTGANWVGAGSVTLEDLTSDLGTDTLLDSSIGIAMAGNFANQELTLTGVALNTWALDTDEVDAVDQMRLYAMFGNDSTPATPAIGDFAGAGNLFTGSFVRAGQAQADECGNLNHTYVLWTGLAE
ncbi:MAG: hypothetical protein Q7J64_00850, partial [Elusimicrobiota bacterium]|nr:hypothetical protein [Elusimicrobiota bacterium]